MHSVKHWKAQWFWDCLVAKLLEIQLCFRFALSSFQLSSGRCSPAALLRNLDTYSGLTMYGL